MYRLLCLATAGMLAAGSAHAVTQTAGFLEIDDLNDKATIDIQFFSISNVEDVEFQFDIRDFLDPPMTDNLAAHLWSVDGAGDLDSQIASGSSGGTAGFSLDRFGGDQLAIGDYAFVVGTETLGMMEFPPFQMDPNTPDGVAFVEYEISTTTGENALQYTCRIEGNLDGTTDTSVFVGGTNCNVPTAVSEPGLLATFGGLALAGLLAGRRRTA